MTAPAGQPPVALDADLVATLHARAGAARWDVTPARFAESLARAIAKHAGPAPHGSGRVGAAAFGHEGVTANPGGSEPPAPAHASGDRVAGFLEGLHLEDLALAVACAEGHEAAWAAFLRTYQAELGRAAMAIAGGEHGQDLADALVADLYGLDPKGTGRRSLFEYFHGRSRLSTWLRALLSRRHIDAVRKGRRVSSLDAVERPDELLAERAAVAPPDPDRARLAAALQDALDSALAGLPPDDRLRLACYHVDEMTLARIARQFGEHEATASRKLQRIRQTLRARIDEHLRQALRLGPDEIRACYQAALDEGRVDLTGLGLVARTRQEPAADAF